MERRPIPRALAARRLFLAVIGGVILPTPLNALTPDSPAVRAAVERACEYLAKARDPRPGARVLIGLTFLKADRPDHPKVREGLDAISATLEKESIDADIYTVGLMLIFLTELPMPERHEWSDEIATLVAHLQAVQKPHGGWGYSSKDTGDNSMTQYAVLGFWSADAAGYDTPFECWERVAEWLMRTQGPDGSHGYQGNDPGNFTPVDQASIRMSMCAAGTGSLYMCADHFGQLDARLDEDEGDLVVKRVRRPGEEREPQKSPRVDRALLSQRIDKANEYLDANFTVSPLEFTYYYIYALERCKTFKAMAEGALENNSTWYDEGAEYLIRQQRNDGHWETTDVRATGNACDTCFATLFLVRSMYKKVIQVRRLGAGVLTGGRGLPASDADFPMRNGTVKRKPLAGPAEDLLGIIGNPDDPDFQAALDGLEEQNLAGDDDHANEIQKRLRDLLSHGKSPQQRAAAVKLLARTHDLRQVPLLIEALKDPEEEVFWAANDALRFISRKVAEARFLSDSTLEASRKRSLAFWTRWCDSLHLEDVRDK